MKILYPYQSSSTIELTVEDLNDLLKLKGYTLSLKRVIEIKMIGKSLIIRGE